MNAIKTALLGIVALGAALSLYSCNQVLQDNRHNVNRLIENTTDAGIVVVWAGAVSISLVIVGGPAVALWYIWHKRRERSLRQEDGSYPLRVYRKNGREIIMDPNRIVEPMATVVPALAAVVQHEPAAGYSAQLRQNQMVQATRTMQAINPGDQAISSYFGRDFRPGRAATAAMLRQAQRPPDAIDEEQPALPAPEHQITLREMMSMATSTQWPIGYSPETGEVAHMRPHEHQHALIVGATGRGKTKSGAYQIAVHAVNYGWHVIVLDGKGGLDWRSFERHAEWHEADASTIADQTRALARLYNSRLDIVKAYGVSEIHKIPKEERPPEILVIIEELGAIMMATEAKPRKYVGETLSAMIARSRAIGLHFLGVTTTIRDWPRAFHGNAGLKIAYRLGENQGAALSMYDKEVERLPAGSFKIAGEPGVFRAFNLESELNRLLRAPRPQERLLPTIQPQGLDIEDKGDEGTMASPPGFDREEPQETERQRAMREWISSRSAQELSTRGAQARLREYMEEIGLPTAKAYVSDFWRSILGGDVDEEEQSR